jgi:hypothetical protein
MRKVVVRLGLVCLVVAMVVTLLAFAGTEPVAASECQGESCVHCFGIRCEIWPASGRCNCDAWENEEGPGGGCIAWGTCTVVY